MLTSQLFEQWNIDNELVAGAVHQVLGPCDIFLGGSLADDLGNEGSDVDLYCFLPPGAGGAAGAAGTAGADGDAPGLLIECGDTVLDLTVVPGGRRPGERESLLPLLLAPAEATEPQLPLLSQRLFRQLHALHRDRSLTGPGSGSGLGPGEAVRVAHAADLLHVYAAVRSVLACAALADDLLALPEATPAEALYTARLSSEYAIDAALATEGLIVVNPKARHALLTRARMQSPLPGEEVAHAGLFPNPPSSPDAVHDCLTATQAFLRHALNDRLVARFELVTRSYERLEESLRARPSLQDRPHHTAVKKG
ncbi:hypothetical protein OG455_06220 [Kitasatospora sp. NBC_01287]|uniref:hypothetical protein n=1 Tax=Kitasatospora sp. NBC_01287 TaxID=2903573 RepID=UPI002254F1D3|nr:hypothetical protein [Kitasatospora sp. NBC_01287]MCX4745125.1 hypothetical protein [Kitasatospora sp. NBC_01287]